MHFDPGDKVVCVRSFRLNPRFGAHQPPFFPQKGQYFVVTDCKRHSTWKRWCVIRVQGTHWWWQSERFRKVDGCDELFLQTLRACKPNTNRVGQPSDNELENV